MRVAVVGAGLAGLTAARRLAPDHEVAVFDKGRSVGGRLATRRIGAATLDHGAQFFTVRGDEFRAQTDDWLERGIARVWCHGFAPPGDGYPRYIGSAGMNSLAKDLAAGLDVRTSAMVFTIRQSGDEWTLVTDDGAAHVADAVVLSCPVPQSWSLLAQTSVEPPEAFVRADYERTIALLAVLDGPSGVPDPGGVQLDPHHPSETFGFVADNHLKGVSAVPAVTMHATVGWSAAHWDDSRESLRGALLEAADAWIGDAGVVAAEVKKWRFATPTAPWPDACWTDGTHRIVLAGDAFAGPKLEGAFLSGVAAARAINAR